MLNEVLVTDVIENCRAVLMLCLIAYAHVLREPACYTDTGECSPISP